ncbi:MAG: hypothetical protein LBE71_06285 [Dysgonamonadaceae bacterium]|jgi:hypothetical protein|nr:hypothetical protein [Dysgonamonadaceae bacterium]
MTAQIGERLYYEGIVYTMATDPFYQFLKNNEVERKQYGRCSACWRGYLGQWKIENDKLYLIGLHEFGETSQNTLMTRIFPNQQEVFADWFSGEIRIPRGEMLKYVHAGYSSLFKRVF